MKELWYWSLSHDLTFKYVDYCFWSKVAFVLFIRILLRQQNVLYESRKNIEFTVNKVADDTLLLTQISVYLNIKNVSYAALF